MARSARWTRTAGCACLYDGCDVCAFNYCADDAVRAACSDEGVCEVR